MGQQARSTAMPDAYAGMPAWGFAEPGPLRDELTQAALAGVKTSTTSLFAEYETGAELLPVAGERTVLLDSAERPVAILETTEVRVLRMADVDDAFAIDEGEGYLGYADWRAAHERYWNQAIDDLRAFLLDPTFSLDDDTLVVAERFRVVERLDPGEAP